MDPTSWKPSDIAEHCCTTCGVAIEFWKDDVKRRCPACGEFMFNPRRGDTFLSWYKKASECLGNSDIEEWKKRMGS
jgi:hypothetical protein